MTRSPHLIFGCFAEILLFLGPSLASQHRPLREIAHELQTIQINNDDLLMFEVPEIARPLLPEWKRGIRQVIVKVLSDPKNSTASLNSIDELIRAALLKEGVDLETGEPYFYGQLTKLDLALAGGSPGWIVVTTAINVVCGEDSSLYVFHKQKVGWKLLLAFSAPEYSEIRDAFENLQFSFSNTGDSSWYVLTAYSPPWCTSCWSGAHFQLLRPSSIPDKPEVVYQGIGGFYRCGDKSFHLRTSSTEFSISYPAMMYKDMDLFTKVAVDHFAIHDAKIQRLPPTRQNAVDFVDQWISLPEDASPTLVAPEALKNAFLWHSRLGGWSSGKERVSYASNYDWEQGCSADGSRWQVKMSLNSGRGDVALKLPGALYFVTAITSRGIVLQDVGTKQDISCTGKPVRPEGADINNLDLP